MCSREGFLLTLDMFCLHVVYVSEEDGVMRMLHKYCLITVALGL